MAYNAIDVMNATNSNTLIDVFTNVNAASGSVFGALLMLTIFFGYLFLFSKEQKIDDMLASSFLTMIVGSLFFFIGIVTWPIYIAGVFLMIALFILKFWMS